MKKDDELDELFTEDLERWAWIARWLIVSGGIAFAIFGIGVSIAWVFA